MSDQHQHQPHSALAGVHVTHEEVANLEMTPPHPPREETPLYRKAHHFLVVEKDSPCEVCGVRNSTLSDPNHNPWKATALETHHYPIERSLMDACDPRKVHLDFPQVYDQPTLETFIDSPANLKVLCSVHHRSPELGIHHLLPADFAVLRYLKEHYQIVATAQDMQQIEAADQLIEDHPTAQAS